MRYMRKKRFKMNVSLCTPYKNLVGGGGGGGRGGRAQNILISVLDKDK